MVWVCPPHTSMNLNSSSPASAVICTTNAPAVVGSLYSSTNLMGLRHRAQPGGVVRGAEDAGDDLDPLLEEIARNRQCPVREIPHLLGRGDGVPRLLELRPCFRPRPAAQRVTDQDADDHSHYVPPVSLEIFEPQNASSSSS